MNANKLRATELRIGNLVSCPVIGDTYVDRKPNYGKFIFPIVQVSSGGTLRLGIGYECTQVIEVCDCEPIPLTAEWLERFGFEREKRNLYRKGNIYVMFITTTRMTENKEIRVFIGNKWYYDNLRPPVKHVHQLQNLYFALTGEELKYKEDTP